MSYVRRYIKQWVSRLSRPHAAFGGQPACPFAAKAMYTSCSVADAEELASLLRCIQLDPWRVMFVLIDFPRSEDIRQVLKINKPLLAERDLLAMVSDPKRPFKFSGYQTTQDVYFMVVIQRKSEVEKASLELRRRGYYANWTQDQLRWLEDRE